MPFDTGLFDQDTFDGGGQQLIVARGSARATCSGYVIRQAAIAAHGSAAVAVPGVVLHLIYEAAVIARGAAACAAEGIRLVLAGVNVRGLATASVALARVTLPPLGRGLRVGRWERPSASL
jgi:hypothetical protein